MFPLGDQAGAKYIYLETVMTSEFDERNHSFGYSVEKLSDLAQPFWACNPLSKAFQISSTINSITVYIPANSFQPNSAYRSKVLSSSTGSPY
ncbi:hypothetical protein EG68_04003 [Paragonimus skrjabini miyazakii]|uniref:Uncharacterized protein n=1 Tax=Paragonimus skrjabini miyazakii TaxID=59628 RepID=A0A8S9YV13_9TREM|nr:hypothetical protein EG68_04003 [Paragonimus skrjabini miyazakii]